MLEDLICRWKEVYKADLEKDKLNLPTTFNVYDKNHSCKKCEGYDNSCKKYINSYTLK